MKNIEVLRYKQKLDNLFGQLSVFEVESELQSHWAKYLCVLVSGFIEISIRAVLGEYTRQRSNQNITRYVASRLTRVTNPNMEDILTLVGRFDSDWRRKLEEVTTDEIKTAVDSVVANRNRIAHGKDAGISYVTLKNYYKNVKKMVDNIENIAFEIAGSS